MIGSKAVYDAVKNCDLFLMFGTDYISSASSLVQVRKGWRGPIRCDKYSEGERGLAGLIVDHL